MKTLQITIATTLLLLFLVNISGCNKPILDPADRDTIVAVIQVARNHLAAERAWALQLCEDKGQEICNKADDFKKWLELTGQFETFLVENGDKAGAELIISVTDTIITEMTNQGDIDQRTLLYVQDIKVIAALLLKKSEEPPLTRSLN